jgi:hypothetical protein
VRFSLELRRENLPSLLVVAGAVVVLLLFLLSLLPAPGGGEDVEGQDPEGLRREVERLEKELEGLAFPPQKQGEEAIDSLLEWARGYGVKLWSFGSSIKTERLAGGEFAVVEYSLDLRGPQEGMIAFLERLNKGPVETAYISSFSLRVQEGEWSVRLQLRMYTKA